MNVGKALKLCRSQRGWTLEELGKRTGIGRSYLSMLERNVRDPSMATIQALSTAFGVPVNVLLFLASDEKELAGISIELKEKLSRAALELLKLPVSDNLF